MTAVLSTKGLGKRYRRRWALSDCTLQIPAGHVVGLVGPNGAGKTTLLNLAVGLLAPTEGTVEILGGIPAGSNSQLAKVGFVAQDTPTYAGLSIADHLRLGAHLNPGWDPGLAKARISQLGLDPEQKAGKLSGGQRAQLALTLAIAKRPEVLILDEPIASLDPLARREFLQTLMAVTAEHELSVVMSSHLVSDLERICDYLIVLVASRVRVAGEVDALLASHYQVTGPRRDMESLPAGWDIISASHTDRQTTLLVLNRLEPALFGARGVAPIGYAAFALALGVTAGVLIRRTVPAMAATLAAFTAVQFAWPNWIRPHLIPPAVVRERLGTHFNDLIVSQPGGRMTITGTWYKAGVWLLSNQTVTPSGHVFTGPATSACLGNSTQACIAWLARQKLAQVVTYQPASRFWAFQWYESAVFVVLAAALGVLCLWWMNRCRA